MLTTIHSTSWRNDGDMTGRAKKPKSVNLTCRCGEVLWIKARPRDAQVTARLVATMVGFPQGEFGPVSDALLGTARARWSDWCGDSVPLTKRSLRFRDRNVWDARRLPFVESAREPDEWRCTCHRPGCRLEHHGRTGELIELIKSTLNRPDVPHSVSITTRKRTPIEGCSGSCCSTRP